MSTGSPMILCVGPTPAAQRVMVFRNLTIDSVNRAVTTLDGAAGKSINVAKVLKALGAEPLALGFIGGDRGAELLQTLRALGIASQFSQVPARTRQCITVIDQSAGTQTELVEESQEVPTEAYQELLDVLTGKLGSAEALVLSGTLTPGAPVTFYRDCILAAKKFKVLTVLDAQGPALMEALPAAPDLVKPNRAELSATVKRELNDEAALTTAMGELVKRGARQVVVTAGKKASYAYDGTEFWRLIPPGIEAVNPIGSGDAFTAGMALQLVQGSGLAEACRWGAAAGAANALNLMAGEVVLGDVERLISQVELQPLS